MLSDVTPLGAVFLGIFLFSLLGFYVAIRRSLLSTPTAGVLCSVITIVSLALYGLSNNDIDDGLACGRCCRCGYGIYWHDGCDGFVFQKQPT